MTYVCIQVVQLVKDLTCLFSCLASSTVSEDLFYISADLRVFAGCGIILLAVHHIEFLQELLLILARFWILFGLYFYKLCIRLIPLSELFSVEFHSSRFRRNPAKCKNINRVLSHKLKVSTDSEGSWRNTRQVNLSNRNAVASMSLLFKTGNCWPQPFRCWLCAQGADEVPQKQVRESKAGCCLMGSASWGLLAVMWQSWRVMP